MQEKTRSILAVVVGAVATLLILGFFNGITWGIWGSWKVYHDLTAFRIVQGQLKACGVGGSYSVARSSGGMHYSAWCKYKYTVDGKPYESGRYRRPAVDYGTPEAAMDSIVDDLQWKNPIWHAEGEGIFYQASLVGAAGTSIGVHYYPPDPTEAYLIDRAGPDDAGVLIGFGTVTGFVDLGYLWALYLWLTYRRDERRREAAKNEPPKIPAPAAVCDGFIPLLDEGIAAAQGMMVGAKADMRWDMNMVAKEFEEMRKKCVERRMGMDHSGLSLNRRFEWSPSDKNDPAWRFVGAITKIDDYYYDNLVIKKTHPVPAKHPNP